MGQDPKDALLGFVREMPGRPSIRAIGFLMSSPFKLSIDEAEDLVQLCSRQSKIKIVYERNSRFLYPIN